MRRCSKCKQEKPATREYFHVNKRAKDGSFLRTECIECRTGNPKRSQEQDIFAGRSERMKAYWEKTLKTLRGAINYLWWNSISFKHRRLFGFDSDLDSDYLEALWHSQKGLCFWTGVPLKIGRQAKDRYPQKMSLDRLDNSKGYVRGNVVWSSAFANRGRGEASVEDFQVFLAALKEHLNQSQPLPILDPKASTVSCTESCACDAMRTTGFPVPHWE